MVATIELSYAFWRLTDPLSRRHVWETINWMKQTRVVVLTTHNMEEADYLGDNIMILHNGRGDGL